MFFGCRDSVSTVTFKMLQLLRYNELCWPGDHQRTVVAMGLKHAQEPGLHRGGLLVDLFLNLWDVTQDSGISSTWIFTPRELENQVA